ncbi:hypothetical protein Q4555_09435 [Octadecabacter sp. 1_MG-2023]|uniref:hypothetical protein n=1 Tax=unclassified Octadecabacter TaxID=196158 RepID=UPI001C08997D|nr:hypothetical protein [Octadecabacter sp. 1_MG-2023]MBU2992349.1 hypothetical protein [Octadecabacter sp. B2R22]MDO6734894.1 hypothetical protein [Octadecabacter sp. 1_MG-2023]
MAKSSKTKTNKSKTNNTDADEVEVTEAEVLAETADDSVSFDDDAMPTDIPTDEDILDDEEDYDLSLDDVEDDPMGMEIVEDPIEVVEPDAYAVDPQPVTQQSSGFMPMALGGLVAGAIGYGVATYFPLFADNDDLTVQLTDQAAQIAALEDQIANIPAPDLGGIESQLTELGSQTAAQVSDLSSELTGQITAFEARLDELEKQPNSDGTLSDTALAAYERELEQLRADLEVQQQSVMTAAAQAEADLAAARAEAEALEQDALAAAEAAVARAALNRVATAVETGAPFADALNDLNDADLPAELTAAADIGVATTAQLTADFPAAARAALATARAEGVSDDAGGFGGFLRSQFDVRSTSPQEGTSPDAILSRAEAAVKEGRVSDALAELEALPEVARADLTDWTARATERADVLNAIATLSETYN